MSSPITSVNGSNISLQAPKQPKPGTFKAGVGATHNIKQDDFITIAQAIQAPENQRKLAALPGEFKLKGDLKFIKPSREVVTVEYFQWTLPPISKAGKWSSYNLEFKLEPRRQNEASAEFVQRSLDQATRFYTALQGDNTIPPGKKGGLVHNPYISPNLIQHQEGGIGKYENAKQAFAERHAELAELSKKGVKVKMGKDGGIRIRVAGPHFYSSAVVDKKVALPADTTAGNIAAFVNKNIDYARSLAVSKGRKLEVPAAAATSRSQSGGGLTGASAVTSKNNIAEDEALGQRIYANELDAHTQKTQADTSGDEDLARKLQERLNAENGNQGGLTGASATSCPQRQTSPQVRVASSQFTMPVLTDDELQRELDALANAGDGGEEEKSPEPSWLVQQSVTPTVAQNSGKPKKPPAPPPRTKPTHLLNAVQHQAPSQPVVKTQPPPRPSRMPAQNQSSGQLPIAKPASKQAGQGLPTVDLRQPQTVAAPVNMGSFAAQAAERVHQRNGNGASVSVQPIVQQQKSSNPFDDGELALL